VETYRGQDASEHYLGLDVALPANASTFRKAGTEAAYIPNDMESHLHETMGGRA
jgi:hypothetical protein